MISFNVRLEYTLSLGLTHASQMVNNHGVRVRRKSEFNHKKGIKSNTWREIVYGEADFRLVSRCV